MTTNSNPLDGQNEDEITRNPTHYEKGLDLAEAGKHQDALGYMQEHLRMSPDDAEVLNDTGAILHCLGRSDEAIDHFVRARNAEHDSAEIVWNLAEAYLAIGKAGEAMRLFDDMHRIGVLNADVLNRTADIFLNQQNKADAVEMLLRSLRIWPDQEVLRPMIDVIRFKRPKIAFFCDADEATFMGDIGRFVKERFDLRFLEGQTEDHVRELMEWSDISWFQWGGDLAITGSKHPKVCKNIIGLHRDEGHEGWPEQVNWANIDVLIAVGNSYTEGALVRRMRELGNQTSVAIVPSDVNVEENHPMKKQLDEINRVLIGIEAEIESEQTDGSLCDDSQDCSPEESTQPTMAAFGDNQIA